MIDVELVTIDIDYADEWNSYIQQHSLPGHALWQWGCVLEGVFNRKPVRLIARNEKQQITGYVFAYHAPYAGAELYSLNFGFHAADAESEAELYNRLRGYCSEHKISNALVSFGRSTFDVSLVTRQKANMLLNLKDKTEETLWNETPKKTRNMVRKAEKNGYSVSTDWAHLSEYYKIHKARFLEKKLGINPLGFFETLKQQWPGDVVLFSALNSEGQSEGGMIFLKAGGVTSYLFNASTPEGASDGVNNLMMWEAIKYFAERGADYIEMGEASEGGAVYNFKKRLSKKIEIIPIVYGEVLKELDTPKVRISSQERFWALCYRFYAFLLFPGLKARVLEKYAQMGRVV